MLEFYNAIFRHFMTALVRGGRDSDEDLTLVFGRLSKMVRESRTEVRRMIVLPTQAAPGI